MNIGLLERPLVLGLLWGLLFGDMATSLSVALFYELFWMDLFPAGTYIPPQMIASTVSTLCLVQVFPLATPTAILPAILLSLPLAWLGARLEAVLRQRQNNEYDSVILRAQDGAAAFRPGQSVLRAVLGLATINALFFLVSLTILMLILHFLMTFAPAAFSMDFLHWGHLWLAGTIGGLLSLRLRRMYAIVAFLVACVVLVSFL